MTFLFFSALLALPLALLPVLLHLLFRRKTPVVMFPTLRFVKSAIRHTAARRKVQRWLLLACRVVLLALLIFAAAQPARQVASAWMSSGDATVVAIVVDTSYSMLLNEGREGGAESTLLARAGANLDELLASDLVRNARVALFPSNPPADGRPEGFQTPAGIKTNWTGLQPQAGPTPLAARVERAVKLLAGDPAPQKWLFVITDVQAKEFAQTLQVPAELKAALIYLTPSDPRSAGVTAVAVEPEDPIPGIGAEAAVEVAGRTGDSRAVAVTVSTVDAPQSPVVVKPPKVAGFDAGGRAQVRFDVRLPAERFMLVRGALQATDNLPWDDERVQLIEVPPRQAVTLLETTQTAAGRFLRLALDPTDGAAREWPLALKRSPNLTGNETAAAVVLTQWPEAAQATQLRDFVRGGGTLLMCLQPGMEDSFAGLSPDRRAVLLELLPCAPAMTPPAVGAYRAAAGDDPLLRGLTDKKFDVGGIVVRRFVPLAQPDGRDGRVVLSMAAANPGPGARTYPLLARKKVGGGTVFTLATLPDPRFTNLPTHPLFLPLMVRTALRPAAQRDVQNVELGNPLVLAGPRYAALGDLTVQSPEPATYVVKPTGADRRYAFDRVVSPGIYKWVDGSGKVVALTNVQYPGAEADLTYRDARLILPPTETHFVAPSVGTFFSQKNTVTEPQPRWAMPLCVVLVLLCVESMMGSGGRVQEVRG